MPKTDAYGYYDYNAFAGKVMGIFTSGGDSQGMNAAVRASVRTALYLGIKIFIIKEGYQGMVDGGEHITEATWKTVSSVIHRGGTVIGSARCSDFRVRDGRLKAAYNLVDRGITNLIVIGGDGSLTGANIFRQDWSGLLDELLENGKITAEQRKKNDSLLICGIVGSIDNDFCGTDMTIGTDSALHRIIEATDAILSTAYSHQRVFILEVMGRHCGYLGLTAALSCGADFLFIPEDPVTTDWRDRICEKLRKTRLRGQRLNIIIVSEGAIDTDGTPITATEIRDVIINRLKMDTRITVLGHVQRGGNPSAFDRILGCRMGHEAVIALAEATPESESVVVSIRGNIAIRISLMDGVNKTQGVAAAMAVKDFKTAVELRGRSFKRNLNIYKMLTLPETVRRTVTEIGNPEEDYSDFRVAIINIGSPSCGMNAAGRSFTRDSLRRGYQVFGIHDGIDGLVTGKIEEMDWNSVSGWVGVGGSYLGTKRSLPEGKFKEIAKQFQEFKIQGLLIIGGFEAYHSCTQLTDQRCNYPEFQIPMVVVPATISNNVPGSEFSLGADTALNVVSEICDRIRQSAQGTGRRVFVVETMGDKCGYLATFAALAGGADAAYIFEEKFTIMDLQQDVQNMISKIDAGVQRGLILRNEHSSENYDSNFLYRVYAEEGFGKFTTKMNIIGHMQQGGTTTPFDRNMGTKMGARCSDWFAGQIRKHIKPDYSIICTDNESACILGLLQGEYKFTPVLELIFETDFPNRIPKNQWWIKFRRMIKVLSQHDSSYGLKL